MAPRLTPHVRHREKYVDIPVAEPRAFVFAEGGQLRRSARTLRQFVSALEAGPLSDLQGYLRRGDFSRWIRDVFGDYPLAERLHEFEARHRETGDSHTIPDIVAAVRERYDLIEPILPNPPTKVVRQEAPGDQYAAV
jgi:hypothetical protein